jgi:formate-dependent nitrite reductase membrane component NrfD
MTETYDRPQLDVLLPSLRFGSAERAERRAEAPVEAPAEPTPTYYGQPMIKSPVWKWPIPIYMWLGGIAGGAAVVGAVADLFGGEEYRATVRHARWLSLGLGAICPILLIQDLGRPQRFLRMLRVFKVSSPLNVGTWLLMSFGGVSGLLAARQAAEDSFIVPRESWLGRALRTMPSAPFTALHGALGVTLGGYTGVVLTSSAVPIWASRGILLGPLFETTAIASGAAALNLIGIASGQGTSEALKRVDIIEATGQAAQLSAALAFDVGKPHRISKPLRRGLWGGMYRLGAVGGGIVAPLALRAGARILGKRRGTWLYATAAALSLAGALVERLSLIEAGKVSARDPLAYQELTRGAPGEARPTPRQQAQRAPATTGYSERVAVPDHSE